MSKQIQIRRGTATEHDDFTGALGEITMDITNKTLRVHDGETPGGTTLAKKSEIPDLTNLDYVIEYQTNSDGSWYRKYKSGWLEQGGHVKIGAPQSEYVTTVFPKPFVDTTYVLHRTVVGGGSMKEWDSNGWTISSRTKSQFVCYSTSVNPSDWYACGWGA